MNIKFTKMHGLGNDFVVINNMNGRIKLTIEQIVFLCDRHKGIGADGVILVEASNEADCFMNYLNADGSEAQMCGNGVRCTTKFMKENYAKEQTDFKIATRSGIKEIKCHDDSTYAVNMGKATFESPDYAGESIELAGLKLQLISMGNPFAIALVEDLGNHDLSVLGPKIENNKHFPNRMNLELVEEKNAREFSVLVWERGCGETLACGTGACAIYALLKKLQKIDQEITINFKGGQLYLSSSDDDNIIMRGPAVAVFSSIIEIN